MRLTGPELKEVADALLSAFDLAQFDQLLLYRLDLQRPRIALGDDYESIMFRVLQYLNAREGVLRLISAARASNPDNAALFALASRHGRAMAMLPQDALERLIVQTTTFHDIHRWLSRLGRIERQVCRIECALANGATSFGTGFLVGPRTVLTNHHVIQDAQHGNASPDGVRVRFDHRMMDDGSVSDSVAVGLDAANPILDWSPAANADFVRQSATEPRADELDHAILRLNERLGAAPIGRSSEPGAPVRGWIDLSSHSSDFTANHPIVIVQHPSTKPLKLAFESRSLIGVNSSGTRIRYRTNTERGSSGAPCFTADLDLIALHHSGDPDFSQLRAPEYNQGVPISALMFLLQQRGVLDALAD